MKTATTRYRRSRVDPTTPQYNPNGTYTTPSTTENCLTDGEASVAFKAAAAQGAILTSLVGYSLIWDSIDDRKNPTSGMYANFHQDVAGLGGQSKFLRETFDGKFYYPITDDLTGLVHLQGGQVNQIGAGYLPLTDNFNLGPTLVRGFAPGGMGPRDISDTASLSGNGLGGTTYFGGSAEIQFPIFGLPKEVGLKGAVFADAGTLFGFQGATDYSKSSVIRTAAPAAARFGKPAACKSPTIGPFVRRWARASSGRRRSDRSASTTPTPSPRPNGTSCRRSTSPAARRSDRAAPANQPKRARPPGALFLSPTTRSPASGYRAGRGQRRLQLNIIPLCRHGRA